MKFLKKVCERLGENNKPIYTVLAIACGKGTVRPTLSITDKKESPDARKYAALRELMTEFIGVPTTMALGTLGECCADLIAKKGSTKHTNAKSFLSFLGICMAAGYFVPKFCNIGMPPVMRKLMPNYDPNASMPAPATTGSSKATFGQRPNNNISLNIYHTKVNSPFYRAGMRV